MDDGDGPLSFLHSRLGPDLEMRVVALPPGGVLDYDEADWHDAIVVVEQGQVELEAVGGTRHVVGCGEVLWLAELPLRALHNRGGEPAMLVAVSRRAHSAPPGSDAPQ
ncbi:cupin domain-containing protein [Micromonospora deserti]|uniref:Cupin n=1 Tax=Micromonospora deserti TaxID=2070366 RepID=A0A2W2CC37_9ACTN|nr:hypothetical protein [Micromonospora deserti]PZF96062.1 hypothetical protein C1I99_17460 [Micromonospora deserti]